MKESNIQTLFGKYLKEERLKQTVAFELKMCKKTSMPFDAVSDHQIEGLKQAGTGLYHKISDSPIYAGMKTRFTSSKPFDCLWIAGAIGYVAIIFYKQRKLKELYLINVYAFVVEKGSSDRKSLTEDRAREIADKIIVLKNKK